MKRESDLMSKTFFYSNTKDVRLCKKNNSDRSPSHKSLPLDHDLVSLTLESDCHMGVSLAAILALAMWETWGWQTGFGGP